MARETVSNPEVSFRGTTKTFEFGFFEDDEQTEPIVPFDSSESPRVQIVAPDGQILVIAAPPSVRPSSNTGFWAYDFHVPPDADVTAVNESWKFAAEVVDANGHRSTYRTTFVVKDPAVIKSGNQERFYPVVRGRPVRAQFRSLVPLYEISLDVVRSGAPEDFLVRNATEGNAPGDIRHIQSSGVHIYQYDVRASKTPGVTEQNLDEGVWQVHWTIRENEFDIGSLVYQIIEVYDQKILEFTRHLRFIADKLEKRQSTRQAYRESDMLAGLTHGLQLVNSVFPSTSYNFATLPSQLQPYLILGAAYWVYLGQLGLSVDLQFNFSGQTTVLDQDQTGGIESLLERYRSALWDQLKEVKVDILRHERRVGVVATRPARARYLYNTVFQVDSQVSTNLINFLNSIGLILVLLSLNSSILLGIFRPF